jgi:hypothetical protein
MTSSFTELLAQRQFMRFWLARIFGVSAHQMLMLQFITSRECWMQVKILDLLLDGS